MISPPGLVFVIDDEPSMLDAISVLVNSSGLRAETFSSMQEFKQIKRANVPSCLILDVRLPGGSGLDFQRDLATAKDYIPIIFISGYGDIPMSVQAMKAGAVDFLSKPFRNQDLLDAIHEALERDRIRRYHEAEVASLKKRVESLTPRERQVLPLVVSGLLNKQIAAELEITEAAAKVHRSQLMRKLGAESVATLVRMALKLGIASKFT
jgi:FixJ family two-component response regulator